MEVDVAAHINYALNKSKSLSKYLDEIELRDYQYFIVRLFIYLKTLKKLLLFWDTGSGKTLVSIFIIKHLNLIYPRWVIIIFIKASIHHDPWLNTLNKHKILTNNIIFIHYDDPSIYLTFQNYIKGIDMKNTRVFIIIDEVHNFISRIIPNLSGKPRKMKNVYNQIIKITNYDCNKLLLITATPVINIINEFEYLFSMLSNNDFHITQEPIIENRFVNQDYIKQFLLGICSYYRVFEFGGLEELNRTDHLPSKKVFFRKLLMSKEQSDYYLKMELKEKQQKSFGFRIFRRLASSFLLINKNELNSILNNIKNIKFSNKFIDEFKNDKIKIDKNNLEYLNYQFLKTYSCKFIEVCKLILLSKGKCLVYETFTNTVGINILKYYLDVFNISHVEYTQNTKNRSEIINEFNKIENINGDIIKVCLFSLAGSEGISFIGINDLIIVDIPWSDTSLRQIIGRSIRFNSHIDLPINRQYVNIHILLSYVSTKNKNTIKIKKNEIKMNNKVFDRVESELKQSSNISSLHKSIDEEMIILLKNKNIEITALYKLLKEVSFETIYQKYSDISPINKEYIFDTLNSLKYKKQFRTNLIIKKDLIKIYFTDDNYLTYKIGYLDKTSLSIYIEENNLLKKVKVLNNLSNFRILDKKIVYNIN